MVDTKIRDLTQNTTPAATDSYVIADSATTNKYINHSDLIKLWTAQVDANSNNLINVGYVESNATNPASVGTVRLGNTENITWRNAGNTADFTFGVDASDRLALEHANESVPELALYRNDSTPTALDDVGRLKFMGKDSVGNATEYGYIRGEIIDTTNLNERAGIGIYVNHFDSPTLVADFYGGLSYIYTGLEVDYLQSSTTNPATAGEIRLGNNEGIYWRNAGNTADLSLQVDTNDRYVFGSGEATISSGNGNLILSRFGVTKIFIGTATTTITNDTTFNNNVTIVQRINGQSGAYIESDADGYEFEAGTGNFFEYKINNIDEYIFDATALTMNNNNLEMGTGYINITSDATGDLMKHDGTGFTRFARGTALQQLRVNSGGTDLEWFTPAAGSSLPARVTFLSTNNAEAWLNQPSGETEIFGDTNLRHTFNATNATQARVTATITSAGQTGAVITPQYSTNQGGAWNELASTTGQLDLAIDATGTTSTSLVDIAAGAQTDIWIRFVGTGGNNMTDPNFTVLTLEFET